MAYKFTQDKTKDMTNFKNFLENNKKGTFLENAVLTLSQSRDANDTLTITLGNVKVEFLPDTSGANTILRYTGKYSIFSVKSGSSKYGVTVQYIDLITAAMLGTKGLLIAYHGSISGSNTTCITKYPIMLTVDSGGELAVVAYTGAAVANADYNSFHVFAYSSNYAPTTYAYPNYSAQQTSLAQIIPYTAESSVSLPCAYVAIHTQVGGEGLTEVIMNGKNYITNGYWYIEE